MRVRIAAGVLASVLLVAGYLWLRRPPKAPPPPPPKKVQAPAPKPAPPDPALVLDAVIQQSPGQRTIQLSAKGGGEATLVLEDAPSSSSEGFGFGRGRLEPAADRTKGAAFVETVARWLQQPPPAAGPAGQLGAFPVSYMRLGVGEGWEAHKLFLEKGARKTELFLNLSADGKRVRLLEKDEVDREDLVAVLALALRDGMPARRAPGNDPLVASAQPLFGIFQPLPRGSRLRGMVAIEGGFLAARETKQGGRRTSEVLLWKHPREAPRQVATSQGVFDGIVPAPGGKSCVLAIAYPRSELLSSRDPGELVSLDLGTGSMAKLVDGNAFGFTGAVSPDGRQLAIAQAKVTQVYDLASRQLVAATGSELELAPLRWSGDGLLLRRLDFAGDRTAAVLYQWRPGQGEPKEAPGPLPSPDGRYRLEVTKEGLAISGPGGARVVTPSRAEDINAFNPVDADDDPRWLGAQHLLVKLEEPMALDLATGKLHYLFPAAGMKVQASSRDGRILIARDERGDSYWAERR